MPQPALQRTWPGPVSLSQTLACALMMGEVTCLDAPHILRNSALRRAAYRQLAGGSKELGQPPAQLRDPVLRGGPARNYREIRTRIAEPADPRDGHWPAGRGHRSGTRHSVRAITRPGACRTSVAAQH